MMKKGSKIKEFRNLKGCEKIKEPRKFFKMMKKGVENLGVLENLRDAKFENRFSAAVDVA